MKPDSQSDIWPDCYCGDPKPNLSESFYDKHPCFNCAGLIAVEEAPLVERYSKI